MLDILFYNNTPATIEEAHEKGQTVSFTTDGFKKLIALGFFDLPHDHNLLGVSSIKIEEQRKELNYIISKYPIEHTKRELLQAIQDHQYCTGDI